jgi:hypothetical protein
MEKNRKITKIPVKKLAGGLPVRRGHVLVLSFPAKEKKYLYSCRLNFADNFERNAGNNSVFRKVARKIQLSTVYISNGDANIRIIFTSTLNLYRIRLKIALFYFWAKWYTYSKSAEYDRVHVTCLEDQAVEKVS